MPDETNITFTTVFLGNPLWLWGAALVVACSVPTILLAVRTFVAGRLDLRAQRSATPFNQILLAAVRRTHVVFLGALGVLAGSFLLELDQRGSLLRQSLIVIALLQGGLWAHAILRGVLTHWRGVRGQVADAAATTIDFLGRVAIWATVALLALDNLGIDVTALIAGAGIAGIAIGLAAQSVLGDLFASVSIILDKPFEVGDTIQVGDVTGSVEHIGVKTTRVRSVSGEQIIVSNSDLLGSRIRNFKRLNERRVVFGFGVTYDTPATQLAAIPEMVQRIVQAQPTARFDAAHLKRFGESSLDYEVVYFVQTPDFKQYLEIHQAIHLEVFRKFAEERISFAYPTRTLYVTQSTAA